MTAQLRFRRRWGYCRGSVVYAETVLGDQGKALVQVARETGLIRWDLGFDVALRALVAALLATAAAYFFSSAD